MPLPRAGRRRRRRRRRVGGNGSGEERSRSSCQGDEEHEEMPAIPQVMQKPNLYRFQSKPVAPPWQPSGGCLDLSLGSRVWERSRRDWGRTFAIRLDLHGCFHTYPDAGGPFQNLQEADKAIHRYLEDRRDPKMCVEEGAGSSMERIVRKALYWPDGTIKKRTRSNAVKKTKERMCQVVQALVDKYNEDHNLLEDDAHKFKDFLVYVSIHEKGNLYYHLNFTTNKGASMDNLIFAEVLVMAQDQHSELVVSCFCTVNLDDNGQHCYGCTKRGHKYMKHPDDSVEFFAGHLNVPLPFGAFREWSDSDGDDAKYMKAKEAKVRRMYKGLDDPATFKRLFTLPPGVTLVGV